MVRPPYRVLLRLIGIAQGSWEDIAGEAAWNGVSIWGRSLSSWCSLILRFITRQADNGMVNKAEFHEHLEETLYAPALDLRIYALKKKALGQRRYIPPDYDSGFMAAMGAINAGR